MEQAEQANTIKLDYTLTDPEDRKSLVEKIIAESSPHKLNERYLDILADYLVQETNKEERKKKEVLTKNHMVTIKRREVSYEELVGKFENGEDGVYNIISNDKNVIFMPKVEISQDDIKTIPGMAELVEAIHNVEEQFRAATGKAKFSLKKQAIEMRKDQYVLKNAYKPTFFPNKVTKTLAKLELNEKFTIDPNGNILSDGILTFLNPEHVSAILCNYSGMKEEVEDKLWSDGHFLMIDFDELCGRALKDSPILEAIVTYKIDGLQNKEIQSLLEKEFGQTYSIEYISALWRQKIPRKIAELAQKESLVWYYTEVEKGAWKRCSRCGEIKLGHNVFFSKNKTSKDGWYSLCKECRNKK